MKNTGLQVVAYSGSKTLVLHYLTRSSEVAFHLKCVKSTFVLVDSCGYHIHALSSSVPLIVLRDDLYLSLIHGRQRNGYSKKLLNNWSR